MVTRLATPGSVCLCFLACAAALGCSEPRVVESRVAPPPAAAAAPVPVPPACVPFTELLVPAEVARWCSRPPGEVVGEGGECVFRFAGAGRGGVRLSAREASVEQHEAMRAALAPVRGTPALLLGPRAMAYYDRARRETTFVFEAGPRLFRLSASGGACEAGPLSRLATLVRARLAPPASGEDGGGPAGVRPKG